MFKENLKQNANIDGTNFKVAIVFSEFNKIIGEKLLKNTKSELEKNNVKSIDIYNVPGALEIPLIAKNLIQKKYYDVIIALGIVIKGETAHFEYVAGQSIQNLCTLSMDKNFPIINGVLTVYNEEQAKKRTERGKEFAQSAIKLLYILKNI